ncbi:Citrate transporter [Allomuricauda ruestringensis DSM 13258]|uniref:Citrate transporter n=1 Tax=Allomuricauda ruestringensis (strain DSM 13258 / CIP 107369 / LMG 19739 / B1) TaxID=886377 RepID=G2PP88_ALLRU|nr:SLC13 family permease [Allomuricauda ruestringensis]AEM70340.1 Citrate transporter [Allomuricauda ruestringensis DSM 13258]
MDSDLIITIVIICIGIVLFIKDYFSIDTTSIIIMALFIVAGVLSPKEGFSGFNHPATLTLGCMFVVSAGVFNSGILDGLGHRIIKLAKIHYSIALITFCLIAGMFSAFVNDTAVVALLLPIALTVCRETKISPGMLLIPISFSALFGGTCTLIGTSTNILVSSYTEEYGLEGFGMFEFSLAALCLAIIGFAYIFFVAPLLLPKAEKEQNALAKEAEKYITELLVEKDCLDIKKPLHKSRLVNDHNVQVLAILRAGSLKHDIGPETFILEGDVMKVMIPPKALNGIRSLKGYKITGDKQLDEAELEKHIYEVIVPFGSKLTEGSLRSLNFRRQYNGSVLAIRQRGEILYEKLADVKLTEGDMLLILGTGADVDALVAQNLVVALSEHKHGKVNLKKAIPALVIAVGVVLAASLNLTSILISSMVGALLLVATSTLKPKEAYEAVEWKVIFMMAGVLSMGTALEKTGGAEKIALFIEQTLGSYDAQVTLSILYLVTFLSTNVLSSKATAALMTPIVISLAAAMEVSERPFLVAVMFACSLTFMTPVSYPTNTMVYAPGNYKFNDFLKVGTPLNIIIWIAATFVIPYFFPFK